jgi:molybdopterin converting factor small subunit
MHLKPGSGEVRIFRYKPMAILKIPTPLRSYTNGQTEISVRGSTVGEVMLDLVTQFPALRPHLYNGKDELRPFVNLFLNSENVKDLQGMDTPLAEDDRLLLIPSIAGGRD